MITRAKNAWAALLYALQGECNAKIELDEEDQQHLTRILKLIKEAGNEIDKAQLESTRNIVVSHRRLKKSLMDFSIDTDELARQESKLVWKERVCFYRKSIRQSFFLSCALLAAIPPLYFFGPDNWWAGALGFFNVAFFSLISTLLKMESDAEFEEVRGEAIAAMRMGDYEMAINAYQSYRDKKEWRLEMMLHEPLNGQIAFLASKLNP